MEEASRQEAKKKGSQSYLSIHMCDAASYAIELIQAEYA